MVGAGIFLSRIAGFVRSRALAHYLGNSDAADAFTYALKLPNLLQNLFGEGVLSASFIPVYVRLMEEKREDEARRVAGAVASLLFLVVSVLVLGGVLAAPLLVDVFAAGYSGEKRDACIRLVRIVFPGTGLLVLSAWCLGVLNSHRRFFLSYVAPVLWNAAIIAALVLEGRATRDAQGYPLATAAAWGAVAGSALQLLVQLPVVLVLLRGLRPGPGPRLPRTCARSARSFVPVVLGRGVVRRSPAGSTPSSPASCSTGAMAGLGYAQMLYLLPISLFGMAVSASELPEMARATGDAQAIAAQLRERLAAGLRRMAFFVVPSTVAFLALGDMVVGLVYRTGRFGAGDALFVWAILAGFSAGPAGRHPGAPVLVGVLRPAATPPPRSASPSSGWCSGRRWARGWPSGCRRCWASSAAGAWWGWRWPAAWPPGSSWPCCAARWPGGWARSSPCRAGCWADCCWRACWRPRPGTASSTWSSGCSPARTRPWGRRWCWACSAPSMSCCARCCATRMLWRCWPDHPPGATAVRPATRARRLALPLPLLLLATTITATTARAQGADDWWARDKALHFGASATLAVAGYGTASLFTCSRPARLITGGGLAIGLGTAKELADRYTGGDPSMKDFTWDVIGTATGLLVAWTVDRLLDRAEFRQGALPVGCAVARDRDVHGVADAGQQPVVRVAGALRPRGRS